MVRDATLAGFTQRRAGLRRLLLLGLVLGLSRALAQNPTTDLLSAVERNDIEAVKKHLAAGADADATDTNSWTSLMHAAYAGSAPIATELLGRNANVNAKGRDGWTPLILSSYQGHAPIVRLLIARKADVNAATSKGTTALIGAAGTGHAEVVGLLLDAGANRNAKDSDGKTAAQYAAEKNHPEVVRMITGAAPAPATATTAAGAASDKPPSPAPEPGELRIEGKPPAAAPSAAPATPPPAGSSKDLAFWLVVGLVPLAVLMLLARSSGAGSKRASSPARTVIILLATGLGLYFGRGWIRSLTEQIPGLASSVNKPASWKRQIVAGLSIESPAEFVTRKDAATTMKVNEPNSPIGEANGYEAEGGGVEVVLLHVILKQSMRVNLDKGVRAAVDQLSIRAMIHDVKHTAMDVTISGKRAKRLSVSGVRGGSNEFCVDAVFIDGETIFWIVGVEFNGKDSNAAAAAKRVIDSVTMY